MYASRLVEVGLMICFFCLKERDCDVLVVIVAVLILQAGMCVPVCSFCYSRQKL